MIILSLIQKPDFVTKVSKFKATCGEGQQVRNRICKSELPLTCGAADAQSRSCTLKDCPVGQCEKIRMMTDYRNDCQKSQTQPQCADEPWWHQDRFEWFIYMQ